MMVGYLLPTPSSPLLEALLQFVCGDSAESLLLPVLISRVNCNSSTVSIVTMHLFNELLKSQHPSVFAALLPLPETHELVPQSQYLEVFSSLFQDPLPCASQLSVSQSSTAHASQSSTAHASQSSTAHASQPSITVTGSQPSITVTAYQPTTTPSTITKYMSDVEFEVASIQSCTAPREGRQERGHDAFLAQLLARIRMFLRQSMEVNLEVTRLLTTLSIVAPPPLFVELFLSRSPSSFVRELDAVRGWWLGEL